MQTKQTLFYGALFLASIALLFVAIPHQFKVINTRVVDDNKTVSITNTNYLKSVDNDVIKQVNARLLQLSQQVPGYADGKYQASDLKTLSTGYSFILTPLNGNNSVKVYTEMSGLNDAVIFIDGKAISADYIPNLYKATPSELTNGQDTPSSSSIEGYKVYPSNTQSENITPIGDKPSN